MDGPKDDAPRATVSRGSKATGGSEGFGALDIPSYIALSDTADSLEDLRDAASDAGKTYRKSLADSISSSATSVLTEAAKGSVWDEGDESEDEFAGFGALHQTDVTPEDAFLLQEVRSRPTVHVWDGREGLQMASKASSG